MQLYFFLKQKTKGSILAFALLVLSMMFAIASSLSVVTVLESKSASSTEDSAQALQIADNGAEWAVKQINKLLLAGSQNNKLADAFSDCTLIDGAATVSSTNLGAANPFTLNFYDSSGSLVSDCANFPVSAIKEIKSIGSHKGTVRAIKVSVLPSQKENLYVTSYLSPSQLNVYDISDPFAASDTGKVTPLTSPAYHMAAYGKFAYIANYTNQTVEILDMSNKLQPTKITDFSVNGGPTGVAVRGSNLWVSQYNNNTVAVYDIDPSNGQLKPNGISLSTGARPYGMAVYGNYLYVAAESSSEVDIFDISDPQHKTAPSVYSIGGGLTSSVAISSDGKYLFVVIPNKNEIQVLNISDKTNPSFVTKISGVQMPYGIVAYQDVLYVAKTTTNSIGVYDITSPDNPIKKNDITTSGLNGPVGMVIY